MFDLIIFKEPWVIIIIFVVNGILGPSAMARLRHDIEPSAMTFLDSYSQPHLVGKRFVVVIVAKICNYSPILLLLDVV